MPLNCNIGEDSWESLGLQEIKTVNLKGNQVCLKYLIEESEKAGLKLNIQKTKIMASDFITSWQIDEETMETVTDFIFSASKITADGDWSHGIKRHLLLEEKLWQT